MGTGLLVVRSRPLEQSTPNLNGEFGAAGFVYVLPAGADAFDVSTPPPGGATVNEQLVSDGIAFPDPEVQGARDGRYDILAKKARREMSTLDFGYWLRFHTVWLERWDDRSGLVGTCRAVTEKARRTARAADAEMQRDFEREERRHRRYYLATHVLSCDGDGDGVCNE